LDLEAAMARMASRKSRHGGYRPKKPICKDTFFAALNQSLPVLGVLRWRFTLPRQKNIALRGERTQRFLQY
jgi:hypothetical protein